MTFDWLKRYMPRGLYGRAALILILPVVTLQLVISVVFIQRHFEDVSDQLSREVARAANVALGSDVDTQQALGFVVTDVDPAAVPAEDQRRWYDLTGRVVARTLYAQVAGTQRIVLASDREATIFVERDGQILAVQFDRRRASASNPHQLLVHMIFFGGLMTVIAFIYMRNQLRPITRLALVADAFGRGQVLPYTPGGATEVRAAGRAFLDMRGRIERQIEQRTMMLSGISHDMRTPLTRMKLAVSMLDKSDQPELEHDINELQQLLDTFLDFARGEADGDAMEWTDAIALVQSCVDMAARDGSPVALVFTEGQGDVMLRPVAVTRAVQNLIGNALRYGTRCEVSVRVTDKSLVIRVEDDGPGIAPDLRDKALRPFVRLDPARNQNKGSGVGLGLAITQDIARGHGGGVHLGQSPRLGGLSAEFVIGRGPKAAP